jgi:tetratricopeptide (TPR) repeat protein
LGDRYTEARTLGSLGLAYVDVRRFEEAIACFQEALAIFRGAADRHSEGRTLDSLGTVYRELKQPNRAITYWRESAIAMLDVGEDEAAARLEQLAIEAEP